VTDIYPGCMVLLPSGAVVEILPGMNQGHHYSCAYRKRGDCISEIDSRAGVSLSAEFLLTWGVEA